MRARTRIIAPLALAVALTAACGESGSSGNGGDEDTGGSAAAGETCAPVPGDQLVALEDDKNLQLADNVLPAVNAQTAQSQPALLPALNAVSAALTTEDLVEMNAAVDVERQSAEEVAAAWVEENGVTEGLEQGSGAVAVGGAGFTESTILANIYAEVLGAAGFDASVREVGSRELYLQALIDGAEIQVFPEYLATVTEFLEGDEANQVASPDADETLAALQPLAETNGLAFGTPSEAVDQNAFAVTQAFADELGVTTLSELAEACGDGSLILGGPAECPERPFCQLGLEETYGLEFAEFQEYGDTGGPLTKAAIQQGEVSIGLIFSSDGALAQG
ncbi:glycine betaine ABC transporter substrate-binding protein [Blastococcus haudaquaticus]|uniref:Osmoprotectant transport system substrate-binding protein n=1 Tax=Blastococcus haudaquaticus TaxID=1938745 RepID=A0A286GYY4_9ACTN|nr:glycine betaine ABC transporter substrate-binding protein [Blastococcus haudaquaticus]SOE00745.1 osmoprotectant transport system substrate-binding protein [Blastococcus haudaquaticus]